MGGSGGSRMVPPDPARVEQFLPLDYGSPYETSRRVAALETEVAALRSQLSSQEEFSRWIDKALTYQTAVMAIAYAGFFILWEKVEGVGHDRLHAIAGILMGLSLAVYIVWTLLQMNVIHQQIVGEEPRPRPDRLDRAGPHVFQFSMCTGLAAAAVVMGIWFFRLLS